MKVKDFVELVIGKISYMPIVDNSAKYADLTKKEDLVDKFGDYEVIKVKFEHDDMSYIVLHISNKDICASYRVRKVKTHLSDYEQGVYFGRYGTHKEYIEEDRPYCMATRELESCNCGGDRSKCNFYMHKDKKMKKKEIKITEKEQRVAVDILQELEMWMMSRPGNSEPSDSEQQIYDIFNKMFQKYRLSRDMFTGMCCTDSEYERSVREWCSQEHEAF